MNLDPKAQWHLRIASGWLGLGDWKSAAAQLEEIKAPMRAHPDVLKLRVAIYCKARRFDLAAPVSDALAETALDDAQFWLNRAAALHQVGRDKEARASIVICFHLKPALRLTVKDNPDLAPLWTRAPA